ncbi:MAG: sulfotransferase family protein [Polyangiales bacterium]
MDLQTAKRALEFHVGHRSATLPKASPKNVALGHLFFAGLKPTVHAARLADRLLYPAYQQQEVHAPVLVFANARSGTTLFHHLLSLDTERFAPMKLYQTVFPSVTLQRLIDAGIAVDARLGRPLKRLVDHSDAYFFQAWDGIHGTGLQQLEEDETLFVYQFLSPGLMFLYPDFERFQRALFLDKADAATRRRVMAFVRDSMQRHLYQAGGRRTLLNKSIWYPPRILSTLEAFPDTRFVYMMRHPYETIPSFLNFFYAAWQVFYPGLKRDAVPVHALAQLAIDYYRHVQDHKHRVPQAQWHSIEFRDFIADPRAAVEGCYDFYGWTLPQDVRARIDKTLEGRDRFKSRQRYTLEDFGLSRAFVAEQLADVFEAHGYAA